MLRCEWFVHGGSQRFDITYWHQNPELSIAENFSNEKQIILGYGPYKKEKGFLSAIYKAEIQNFIDARYVSASEAYWRLFGFHLHQPTSLNILNSHPLVGFPQVIQLYPHPLHTKFTKTAL